MRPKNHLLLLAAILIAAPGCQEAPETGTSILEARRNARPIYLEQCAPCHGELADGKGANQAMLEPKPRDYTDPTWRQTATPESVYDAIKNGVRGSAMPPWGPYLSEGEIRDLASYVLSVAAMGPNVDPETATPD